MALNLTSPPDTTKMAQVFAAIRALVVELKRDVQSGTSTFASAAGTFTLAVTYPVTYPAGVTPKITATANSTSVSTVTVSGKTNTGFNLTITRTATAAPTVDWIAIA